MRKYRLAKYEQRDDCDYGLRKTTIGYFPSRKSAFEFAHYENNVEMWKQEYKKVIAIITMTIELETYKDDDLENDEILWIFE